MPNMTQNARIICPYFLRLGNNGRSVMCEGLAPGSEIMNCFRGSKKFDKWVHGACETLQYADHCPLARAVGEKYE